MENEKKCYVLKDGKLLMANKDKARKFNGASKAIPFIKNLIRVSTKQKLTLDNFNLIWE